MGLPGGLPPQLMQMLAQRRQQSGAGQPMGGPAAPPGNNPNGVAQQVQQQISQVQELNPQEMLKQLNQWYEGVVNMIPRLALRVPNAGSGLTQAMKGLQGSIEAVKKLASTLESVGGPSGPKTTPFGGGPINLGAANATPPGAPQMPGGSPAGM